ncbi:hypothetical protein K9L67_00365 [Candidatus Woesearchaeota archaeon]|nr:hypothetical protein [Candidatus Woesearchaeota archaeon]MCF7900660.1 hypothetical protein [Candidatus Woesearchaeota archaeon]MCF8013505.1 hypothetical protein [Candidatus Woesearchaeota archaeon]
MKKTIILLLILTLVLFAACEQEKKVIYEEEIDDYTPSLQEIITEQTPQETKKQPQENTKTEITNNSEIKPRNLLTEDFAELDMQKKRGEIWGYFTILADEINGKDILAFTAELKYDDVSFDLEYETTTDELICEYNEGKKLLACASPNTIPNKNIINFRLIPYKNLEELKEQEFTINIIKLNTESVNITISKPFSLGCSTGKDCEEGNFCIAGLCQESCKNNLGSKCSYKENTNTFSGICVQETKKTTICDSENVVNVGKWSKYRGYWSDCKAPKDIIEENSALHDSENQIFHKETCDPGKLSDGFNGTGICYFGECKENKPNLMITNIQKINNSQGKYDVEITVKNTGIKEAYFDKPNAIIVNLKFCENEECTKTQNLGDSKNAFLKIEPDKSRVLTIKTEKIQLQEKIKVTIDPTNIIKETTKEDNILIK